MKSATSRLHWNYFLALENDLEKGSRFIEFCEDNYNVYSIELAHLIFTASSEVEVVAKQLCKIIDPNKSPDKINELQQVIMGSSLKNIADTNVFLPRFGIEFNPWINWKNNESPIWWKSYNKVKHERHNHYKEATLENALNALGALLVINFNYYSYALSTGCDPLSPMDTMKNLNPQSSILRLSNDHYYGEVLVGKSEW